MLLLSAAAWAASVTLNPGDDVATLTASLGAGDVITFNAGTYSLPAALYWTGVGTADAPITLQGKGDVTLSLETGWVVAELDAASYVVIDGLHFQDADGNTDGSYGLYLHDVDHVTVRNCEFGPVAHSAFTGDGTLDTLTIEHNEVHDTTDGYGMYWGCDDAQCWLESSTISNNWIHDIGGTYNYALYVAMGGQGNTIVDNVIYGNLYRGLSVHSTEYGPYNEVRGNAIWSVGDIGLYVRGAARVWDNLVFDVDGVGIYTTDNDHDILDDVVITHNTVWNTTSWGAYIDRWSGRTGNAFANNAIDNITGYGLEVEDGGMDDAVLFSSNVVSGLVSGVEDGSDGVVAGGGDGDFVDAEGWDLYPSSSGALVGAGDPQGFVPDVDFNGVARDGAGPDVGAYERTADDNPGWVLQEGFKDTSPVDADDGSAVGGCCGSSGDTAAKSGVLLLPMAGFWRFSRSRSRRNRR